MGCLGGRLNRRRPHLDAQMRPKLRESRRAAMHQPVYQWPRQSIHDPLSTSTTLNTKTAMYLPGTSKNRLAAGRSVSAKFTNAYGRASLAFGCCFLAMSGRYACLGEENRPQRGAPHSR